MIDNAKGNDNLNGTKRSRSTKTDLMDDTNDQKAEITPATLCCYCSDQPSSVVVFVNEEDNSALSRHQSSLSSQNESNAKSTDNSSMSSTSHHYCLLHYYTTNIMIRNHITSKRQRKPLSPSSSRVEIYDEEQYHQQLSLMQTLFRQAYTQLQQHIEEVTMNSSYHHNNRTRKLIMNKRTDDPLSILSEWNQMNKKKRVNLFKPKPSTNDYESNQDNYAGGFIRNVPLPERFIKKQIEQSQKHKEWIEQMKQDKSGDPITIKSNNDTTRRRPNPKKSIWNSILDSDNDGKDQVNHKNITESYTYHVNDNNNDLEFIEDKECTSCHTIGKVVLLQTNSIRKCHDATNVGETWGNKDRDDEIMNRYHCYHCNKVWNDHN